MNIRQTMKNKEISVRSTIFYCKQKNTLAVYPRMFNVHADLNLNIKKMKNVVGRVRSRMLDSSKLKLLTKNIYISVDRLSLEKAFLVQDGVLVNVTETVLPEQPIGSQLWH